MSGGAPSDEGEPAPGSAETALLGAKPSPDGPAAAIHEEATILGGLDVSRPDERSDERPAGIADLPEFRRALVDIGLFDESELDALAANVPESQGVPGLATFLQQAGRLTVYQAAAVYQRKSRGLLIGNYTILEKLGAGGMGVVFKARHRKLGLVVALKILPPSFARDKTAVARFKREVEAAGRLKHPNIVSALDADEDRGVHFMVMEYVEGSDLDNVVRRRGPLPLGQAVEYVIQAARGLEAAHAQGIVHRDIKPSNLMLDATGTVRVLDLGLARIAEDANPFGQAAATRLTASGMYMGTVDYMAPEQAEDARTVDHRADIYSLGCTLYYLLTGREPFAGETVLKRLMAHLERPAPMLRASLSDAPMGLEDVYQRMMAKRPADRPATMADLIPLLEMCQTAIVEAPAAKAAAPKSPARLMVFDEPARKPEKGAAHPPAGRDAPVFAEQDDTRGLQVGSELDLADLVMDARSEVPLARRAAAPIRPVAGKSRPSARSRPLNLILPGAAVAVLVGFIGFFVLSNRSSSPPRTPPGKGIVPNHETIVREPIPPEDPGKEPTPVPKAPIAEREPLVEVGRLTGHDHPHVENVHPLRDGKTLLTTCSDGKARLWDLATGRELRRFCHPDLVRPAAVDPDGRYVLTGCNDGFVRLWDIQTGEGRPIVKHDGRVWAVAISPDGTSGLSAGDYGHVLVLDLRKGGETRRFETHNAWDWSLAFSPDGRRALTGSGDGVVWLADLTRNDPPVPLRGQPEFAFSVDFAPDGRHAASSALGQLTYWDLETRQGVKVPLDRAVVPSLKLSPDGRRIWFATHATDSNHAPLDEGVIGSWDTDGRSPPAIVSRRHGHLHMDLLPDGGIVTADLDGVARIWRPSRSLERARKLAADGQGEAALAEYSKLVADRPDDARLMIERGRLLYEQGRSSEADADCAEAARLAPDNPQLFLDTAGWWIAGTYPPDLTIPQPFLTDAAIDPSKPAPPAWGQSRPWTRAAVEMQGMIDFKKVYNADDAAAYALAIFHCTTEHEVVFLQGRDDHAAVCLNGNHLLPDQIGSAPYGNWFTLIKAKAGRNTILVKMVNQKGGHSLNLMITQAPADYARARVYLKRWGEAVEDYKRALVRDPSTLDVGLFWNGGTALAEMGRWSEAIDAWRRVVQLDPPTESHHEQLLAAYLAIGDRAAVGRVTGDAIERCRHPANSEVNNQLCWTIALTPDGMRGFSPHVRVVAPGSPVFAANALTHGAVLYRTARSGRAPKGRFESAANTLKSAIRDRHGKDSALDWVFLSMALHHARKTEEAAKALAKARELAKDPSLAWYQRVEIEHLLAEAGGELSRAVD